MFSCKFTAYFSEQHFLRTPLEGCFHIFSLIPKTKSLLLDHISSVSRNCQASMKSLFATHEAAKSATEYASKFVDILLSNNVCITIIFIIAISSYKFKIVYPQIFSSDVYLVRKKYHVISVQEQYCIGVQQNFSFENFRLLFNFHALGLQLYLKNTLSQVFSGLF